MRRAWLLTVLALLLSACVRSAPESAVPDTRPLPAGEESAEWTLADFAGCFDGEWETAREEHTLGEGLTVTLLSGVESGATVYVVAGIHGDETAGYLAAELLRQVELRAGTLCIVSPANAYGAEHDQRKTEQERDLNRNFPGDADGCDAERIAAAIFADISQREPVLLLDLHEAHEGKEERDALGNSIVCGSVEASSELVWDMLLASENGELFSSPLTLYDSPPRGSINRTVTELLGIPAITVETLRTEPLAQRVRNHLETAAFVLRREQMI